MFWFLKSTIPTLISFIVILFFYKNYNKMESSKKFLFIFSFFWIFLFIFHYLLGIYSPVTYNDNATISISRIIHENNYFVGGNFLHDLLGGLDFFGSQSSSGQYFSLEKLIFKIFPLWVAILFHKLILIFLSFGGFYLLSNKVFNNSKLSSILVASFFSVINPYATYVTFLHGITFAAIPYVLYVLYYLNTNKLHLFYLTLTALIISISTSPLHSFPSLLAAILFTPILKKPENYKRYIYFSILLISLTLLNWSENLYGVYEYGKLSARFQSSPYEIYWLGTFKYLLSKGNTCLVKCEYLKYSPFFIITIITILFSFLFFKKHYLKYYLVILLVNFLHHIFHFFVNIFSFETIKTLNVYNTGFYLYIPVLLLALNIIKNLDFKIAKKFILIFPFFSIILLLEDKFDLTKKIFFEPQSKLYKIKNLRSLNLPENIFYRAVSTNPHYFFHPNFANAYGLSTSDGYTNIIQKNYVEFWNYGVLKKKFSKKNINQFGGDLYLNRENLKTTQELSYYLLNNVNLNNLKLINTKFILSYVPLKIQNLKLVSGSKILPYNSFNKSKSDYYKNILKEKIKYLGNPPNIYIYELSDASDRAFFPEKIHNIEDTKNLNLNFQSMSDLYNKNHSYSFEKNLVPGQGKIYDFKKIKDGYEVNLNCEKEGVFVLNTFFNPYWRVKINNQDQEIINLSDVQIGVKVKKGKNRVRFLYSRKLLRQKIFD